MKKVNVSIKIETQGINKKRRHNDTGNIPFNKLLNAEIFDEYVIPIFESLYKYLETTYPLLFELFLKDIHKITNAFFHDMINHQLSLAWGIREGIKEERKLSQLAIELNHLRYKEKGKLGKTLIKEIHIKFDGQRDFIKIADPGLIMNFQLRWLNLFLPEDNDISNLKRQYKVPNEFIKHRNLYIKVLHKFIWSKKAILHIKKKEESVDIIDNILINVYDIKISKIENIINTKT